MLDKSWPFANSECKFGSWFEPGEVAWKFHRGTSTKRCHPTQPKHNTPGKKNQYLWTNHNKKTLRKQGFNFKENFSSQTCPSIPNMFPPNMATIMSKWTQNETNELLQKRRQLSYLGKPVEKGFRQAFSSSSLVQWILAGKQSGLTLLNSESHSQFGDVNLAQIRNSKRYLFAKKSNARTCSLFSQTRMRW